MSRHRNRQRRSTGLSLHEISFLDGLLEGFADLSDGAWQACCEDAIRASGEFKGRDPFDVWLAWVEATGVQS